MATFKKGILGGFTGKVGNVIGYSRNGKNVMRSIAEHVNDKKSESQLVIRERFKELVALGSAFVEAARVGMAKTAKTKQNTTGNSFFSKNWDNVHVTDDGVIEINYSKLSVSDGHLTAPSFKTPKTDTGMRVDVQYDAESDVPRTDDSDEVYIFVYQPELKQGLLSAAGLRSGGTVGVKVPALWSGTEVHIYGFAVGAGRENHGMPSNTIYLGKSTVE